MLSAPTRSGTIQWDVRLEELHPRLRLRLKPTGSTTDGVDGGWWPRSWDLGAELPSLLAVLAVHVGRVERVSYHVADWAATPRQLVCGGTVVRASSNDMQPAGTVAVLAEGRRVTLLVVSPQTPSPSAHAALMAAGHRGNTDLEALLGVVRRPPQLLDEELETALERWDLDGGRSRAHMT